MILIKQDLIAAAKKYPVFRVKSLSIVYIIVSIISLFYSGFSVAMLIQLIIASWLFISFHLCISILTNNTLYSDKVKQLPVGYHIKVIDRPTVVFFSFIIIYYLIFKSYILFTDGFSWETLFLILINLVCSFAILKDSVSFNAVIGTIEKFGIYDEMVVSEEEFQKYLKKWNLTEEKIFQ